MPSKVYEYKYLTSVFPLSSSRLLFVCATLHLSSFLFGFDSWLARALVPVPVCLAEHICIQFPPPPPPPYYYPSSFHVTSYHSADSSIQYLQIFSHLIKIKNNTLRTICFCFCFCLSLDPHISGYLHTHSTTAYPHLLSPPPAVPGTSL